MGACIPSDVASVIPMALPVTMNRPITYYIHAFNISCAIGSMLSSACGNTGSQASVQYSLRVVIDCPLFSGFLPANQLF